MNSTSDTLLLRWLLIVCLLLLVAQASRPYFGSRSLPFDGEFKPAEIRVKSISELKSTPPETLNDGDSARVLGYYTPGDGGGGLFFFDASATEKENGGTIVAPAIGTGRWKRSFDGPLNTSWFGIYGDGIHDDTNALASTLRAGAETGKAVYIPAGSYRITRGLELEKNQNVYGDGNATKITVEGVGYSGLSITNKTDVVVRDIAILASTSGAGPAILVDTSIRVTLENVLVPGHDGKWETGIQIRNSPFCTLQNCTSRNALGTALLIEGSSNSVKVFGGEYSYSKYNIRIAKLNGIAPENCTLTTGASCKVGRTLISYDISGNHHILLGCWSEGVDGRNITSVDIEKSQLKLAASAPPNGTSVWLNGEVMPADTDRQTEYYVVNASEDVCQLSKTKQGPPIKFGSQGKDLTLFVGGQNQITHLNLSGRDHSVIGFRHNGAGVDGDDAPPYAAIRIKATTSVITGIALYKYGRLELDEHATGNYLRATSLDPLSTNLLIMSPDNQVLVLSTEGIPIHESIEFPHP